MLRSKKSNFSELVNKSTHPHRYMRLAQKATFPAEVCQTWGVGIVTTGFMYGEWLKSLLK